MKKLIAVLIVLYFILGIIFYIQDLRYSRLAIHIGDDPQKIAFIQELPTALTMIFLWPFLIAGKVVG